MRKARLLRPPPVDTPPTPIEPGRDTAFAVYLCRYSRWPDLKAGYHCRFEADPERLRAATPVADSLVAHGED